MTSDTPSQPNEAPPAPPRRRRVMRRVRVTRVQQLTPHMVRVTFTGDDLGAFAWNGPASHIKLLFPEEGQDEPQMPDPDGPRSTHMRTYTPRRFDPAVPELDVEFVLHGEGLGSTWAAQAQVGQRLILSGPGPNYVVDPDADWYLLIADETALPAVATILEVLPATTRVYLLLEVVDFQDEQELLSAAPLDITWVHRGSDPAQAGVELEQALLALPLPPGAGRIYVGCEASAMRRLRQHLLRKHTLDPAMIVTRGYWRRGAVAYTDRDYGTDE